MISYTLNDDAYEYNWEGNLSTYQSEQVVLPEVDILLEEENNIVDRNFPSKWRELMNIRIII